MQEKLSWGILGTGNIAKKFANGVLASKTGVLAAVGSRSQASADKFGDEFKIAKRHGSYETLLADPSVQAVYISTPHPMHAEWAIKCADAGKNILCEKPLALNQYEAMAIIEAARKKNVFLMEAFMYRCHPQTQRLVELIREKAIGDVRVIQATFSFHAGFNPESRLYKNALAGGGILDVGCYCTSMSRLIAGAALDMPFVDPIGVKGFGVLGSTGVDEYTAAVLNFPGNIIAQVSTGVAVNQENCVRIYGSKGSIVVPEPWIPARNGGKLSILLHKQGEEKKEITVEVADYLYAIEADTVALNLARKEAQAMTWDDSLGNMKTLDQWREAIGLVYDAEKPDSPEQKIPVHKRPLAKQKDAPMKYGRIEGLDKQVSRLVMGVDNQRTITHASVMFDDFIEKGGNCFDVAYVYKTEKVLGHWIKNRNIRDQIVVLGKGAHTPHCNPAAMTQQLHETLEQLQTNYLDIYMLHRDNPDVPVGEFVDVLNEHKRAGRIRVFGGSNWSIDRVDAANEYAKKKGLTGFCAVSNNFSLARMIDPVWGGCISASDPKSRAWFKKTQTALMAWSSQARGFFTERASPENTSDAEMVRCWYSEDNWRRRERVLELAKKRNVLPINIALAYVLCQPFPTFPLIGPRILAETRTSLPALNIELSQAELNWLNLE